MKTDQELLALAARAVGAEMTDYSDRTPDRWQIKHADGRWRAWDPLADDGDRYRLARELGMVIDFSARRVHTWAMDGKRIEAQWGMDQPDEAHTIVLVAAQCGERMP